jgi:hypothetical protein
MNLLGIVAAATIGLGKPRAAMKTIGPSLATCAFAVLLQMAPSYAVTLLTINGTVGDSYWTYLGKYPELILNFGGYFQANGGPGGPLSITYNGPAFLGSFSEIYTYSVTEYYRCNLFSGCTDQSQYYAFGDEVSPPGDLYPSPGGVTSFTQTIDSTWYNDGPVIFPAYAPIGTLLYSTQHGYINYRMDDYVDPSAIGQGYSITVTVPDAAAVPEPSKWALMLFGFGSIGWMLRTFARKAGGFACRERA